MQPLGPFDLYLNIFAAVVLPLLIIANLTGRSRRNPRNAYLWQHHQNFMWLSMAIIGLLSIWSLVQLGGHFGLISSEGLAALMPVIGIPFLVLAVAEIAMGVRLALQYVRSRRPAA
jgi:hypothetical protein